MFFTQNPTAANTRFSASSRISLEDQMWLEKVEAYVNEHLDSGLLSVPGLADECAMSESSLLRRIKKLTGMTPVRYLQMKRLMHARHLLDQRVYNSVQQVAYAVGYGDTRSFSRCFQAEYGCQPSALLR